MTDLRFYDSREEAARAATRWHYIQLEHDALEAPSPLGQAIYNALKDHPGTPFSANELLETVRTNINAYVDDPADRESVTAYLEQRAEQDRHDGDRSGIGLTLMNLMVIDDRINPSTRISDTDNPDGPTRESTWTYRTERD